MNDLTKNPGCCIYKHGGWRTKEYCSWQAIKERCHNPNSQNYPSYGGAGITMCDRWRNSFENFIADMGKAPSPKHSVDRFPDRKGIYEPSNCRWATPKEQASNKDWCVMITYNGETKHIADWSLFLGIKRFNFTNARRRGKSLEGIIAKHLDPNYNPKDWEILKPYDSSKGAHAEHKGATMSLKTWAAVLDINYKYLHQLIKRDNHTIQQILGLGIGLKKAS